MQEICDVDFYSLVASSIILAENSILLSDFWHDRCSTIYHIVQEGLYCTCACHSAFAKRLDKQFHLKRRVIFEATFPVQTVHMRCTDGQLYFDVPSSACHRFKRLNLMWPLITTAFNKWHRILFIDESHFCVEV